MYKRQLTKINGQAKAAKANNRQTKRQLKQEKRAATWMLHTDAALTHKHTHACCSPLCTYIFICTLRFAHTFTYTYTHICRLNILLLCLHNRRRRHREHVQQQACWRSRCCRCRRSLPAGVWARKRYDAAPNSTASFFARTFIPPWCKRDDAIVSQSILRR